MWSCSAGTEPCASSCRGGCQPVLDCCKALLTACGQSFSLPNTHTEFAYYIVDFTPNLPHCRMPSNMLNFAAENCGPWWWLEHKVENYHKCCVLHCLLVHSCFRWTRPCWIRSGSFECFLFDVASLPASSLRFVLYLCISLSCRLIDGVFRPVS